MNAQPETSNSSIPDTDLMLALSGVNKLLEEIEALRVCLNNITDLLAARGAPKKFISSINKKMSTA